MSQPTKDQTKQQLRNLYKERTVVGGIYAIKNTANGRMLVATTADLKGAQNRFAFAKDNPTSLNLKLLPDIKQYGIDAFKFEILEELDKKPTQSAPEFTADLEELQELWQEKLGEELLY
jgi:hypothetical protein